MTFCETLNTQVKYECDVLVCGGGFGGISAALAAARENKKVILLERQFMLGGLATAGLVTIYLALCDGYGKQVSYGIAEELLRLSVSMGDEGDIGKNWWQEENGSKSEKDSRFEAKFNPHLFAALVAKLLTENGVTVLYGTYAVSVHMNGDKIDGVIVENKSGRLGIKAKAVVDATGDADIAYFAGADTETFKQGNVLAAWYYSNSQKNGYRLMQVGFCDIPDEDKVVSGGVEVLDVRRFTGVDGQEVSEFALMAQQHMLNHVIKSRKDVGEDYVPVTMPSIPQLRMTRKLVGEYALSNKEMHTYFEDSIGMVSDWRKRGPIYEVPFRTLYSKKVKNLIMAGRCTSVTEPMWDIMRVIPCCAVTGEAAGVAAAMTDDFSSLDVALLQERLRAKGVVIHEKDINNG